MSLDARPGRFCAAMVLYFAALLALDHFATLGEQLLLGVATAVLLVVPFGVLAWRRAIAEGAASRGAVLPLFLAGLAIQLPIIGLALLFGRGAG